ncbi:MAG: DNA-binding protein [Candidatus Berkiella sp.]
MGRIGIVYEDVAEAALQLQAQGKIPTVDAVRHVLGTGSKTTINQHLKQWKAEQGTSDGSLPSEILTVVSGLWDRIQAQAQQAIEATAAIHQAEREELQSAVLHSREALLETEHRYEELDAHYQAERKQVGNLETENRQVKQALLQLEERFTASQHQLADAKAENTRLHQLASQIQTNLEHYQQSIEQLRMEQALEYEKQNTIHLTQLSHERDKVNALSYELESKSKSLTEMLNEVNEVRALVEVLRGTSHQHENEKLIANERNKYLEQLIEEKISAEQAEKLQTQTYIAQLLQQNQRLQTTVDHLLRKQENLEGEKTVLKKENTQLHLALTQTENT